MPPLVISYYTPDNEYQRWAQTLLASCRRAGYQTDIQSVTLPGRSTWEERVAYKAEFLLHRMQAHKAPLLWLDADSEVTVRPALFDNPPFDLGVTILPASQRLRSGTMYLRPAAMPLLSAARDLCIRHPERGHERNLTEAWHKTKHLYRTEILGREYNFVPSMLNDPQPDCIYIRSNFASNGGRAHATFSRGPAVPQAPLVISFYTADNEYAKWVRTLTASLDRAGYESEVCCVDLSRFKTWGSRVAYKADFQLRKMQEHRRALLWLDADSEMLARPPLFEVATFDFGVTQVASSGRLRSGTMYMTPAVLPLLQRTAALCHRHTSSGHEINLTRAWRQTNDMYSTQILPRAYNWAGLAHDPVPGEDDDPTIYIRSNHESGTGYHNATFAEPPADRKPADVERFRTLITSFYADSPDTKGFYRRAADALRLRCDDFGFEADIRERQSAGDWIRNCGQKPLHILEVLAERQRPVLWLDADCTIHTTPWECERIPEDVDVAVAPYEGCLANDPPLRIRCATIYARPTPGARAFFRAWADLCSANRSSLVGDHLLMQVAYNQCEESGATRFGWLPESYAYAAGDAIDKSLTPVISIGLAPVKDRVETMHRFARRDQTQLRQEVQTIREQATREAVSA